MSSTDGGQPDAWQHGVVSVKLAVGIAVASSAATAVVCVVLCAIVARQHIIRKRGKEPEFTIEQHKSDAEDHQHERDHSTTQASKSKPRSSAASTQSRSPTLRASPASLALDRDGGADLVSGRPAHERLGQKKDDPVTPLSKLSTEVNNKLSLAPSISFSSDHKDKNGSPPQPQLGLLRPEHGNMPTDPSLKEYTPSMYKFASPPESIVRSRRILPPPNLTTEYSAVSLSGFAEFAPWVANPVLNVPMQQEDQKSRLSVAVEAPRTAQ